MNPEPVVEQFDQLSEEYLMGAYDALATVLTSPRVTGEFRDRIRTKACDIYRQIMEMRGKPSDEIEADIAAVWP